MVFSSSSDKNVKNKVIILNKPFLGGWLNNEGNIAHEIIDFLRTDSGDYFVYNNPWGICPNNIGVENDISRAGKGAKYFAKYLVLTSNNQKSAESIKNDEKYEFKILYVIELVEKLHNFHTTKIKNDENNNAFGSLKPLDDKKLIDIQTIIKDYNIRYNNKYLHEIYGNDGTLYVTFRANKVYKARNPILVNDLTYNFQRNKGYVFQDKYEVDYSKIISVIEQNIMSSNLEEQDIPSLAEDNNQIYKKTFMSLIGSEYNENLYTNMLFSVLKHKNMMINFLNKFDTPTSGINYDNYSFKVFKERQINNGRIDICAESEQYIIIIENKVLCGLNGIRDEQTQLKTYYEWATKSQNKTAICFVIAPNFRVGEIQYEIQQKDQDMLKVYKILTFDDIAEFLTNTMDDDDGFEFLDLKDQIINSFKNMSYDTVEKLYAQMFLDATK